MTGWLPMPRLSGSLFVTWLLLVGDAGVAHALLAALLAVLLPWLGHRLRRDTPALRRPLLMAKLLVVVLRDIVLCNLQVARLVLGPQSRIRPGYIRVPLALRNDHAISMLAGIITMTPGTLSCDLSDDRRHLLVHCLDLDDAEATIAQIKQSYEQPLLGIFPS